MYKYEYESVSCDFGGWGFGSGNVYEIEDYRSIINKRASDGWRYVGFIPTKQRGTGHTQEIDLIFEKFSTIGCVFVFLSIFSILYHNFMNCSRI